PSAWSHPAPRAPAGPAPPAAPAPRSPERSSETPPHAPAETAPAFDNAAAHRRLGTRTSLPGAPAGPASVTTAPRASTPTPGSQTGRADGTASRPSDPAGSRNGSDPPTGPDRRRHGPGARAAAPPPGGPPPARLARMA